MKELTINTPGSYIAQIQGDFEYNLLEDNNYIDANNLFWQEIFSEDSISKTLEYAQMRYRYSSNTPIKIQITLANIEHFKANLNQALHFRLKKNTTQKKFWSCLETLEMFCKLYTFCYSLPFELSITEGFVHNTNSSEILNEYCLNRNLNPYLEFVEKRLLPIICECNPEIIWITGKLNIISFTIAQFMKMKNPNIFIALCDYKTDYYSLYKIRKLLSSNDIIFHFFDFVLLHDLKYIREMIIKSIKNQLSFKEIPGLLYKNKKEKIEINDIPLGCEYIDNNDYSNLELKLFPQNCCYWNKCTFCGINQKYSEFENNWNISKAIDLLKKYASYGIENIWLVDEAIPPSILKKILLEFKKNNLKFVWHLRTRIEPGLLDIELIDLLEQCGIKSLILGFESASKRILKLMNKTEHTDYLEIAEKIVKEYTNREIHIHFPVLIGFPTETDEDREYSFKFVDYLHQTYPLFSYNINILELDISSKLYKNWEKYNIWRIEFPCLPKYFLGNSVTWNCDIEMLDKIRTKQMHKQFPWFPKQSYININTFYSIWEHKRGILYESAKHVPVEYKHIVTDFTYYSVSSNVILFQTASKEYCLYNYDLHNYILGGEIIFWIYNSILNSVEINDIVKRFNLSERIVINFLDDLLKLEFLIKK